MRTLVAGWFSFPGMGATAGDLLAREVVCEWLERAGDPYDVANSEAFEGGVDWQAVDPGGYTSVVFVCGPFGNGGPIPDFLERFAHCRKLGMDLTMLHHLDEWNPFDLLWERDSSRGARPDIAFLSAAPRVPVVGVVLVQRQKEYANGMHAETDKAIRCLTESREMAVVNIDTCLDPNRTGLRTPAQVESLIARMDAVVSTRLHGLVLSLKNEVPVVAIDPVRGGAKVLRQAQTIGWPAVLTADQVTGEALNQAFDYCRTQKARGVARECRTRAQRALWRVRDEFLEAFRLEAATREGSER